MKQAIIYNKVRKMAHGLLLLCAAWLMGSCGLVEIEHSENGKLDGYWHLVQVDTLSTGGTCDLRQDLRYWIFQGTLFQLFSPDLNGRQLYVSHFRYEGDRLTIEKVYKDDRTAGDPEVEEPGLLRPFGVNQLEGAAFQIETLSGGSMTLSDDTFRLSFKKH